MATLITGAAGHLGSQVIEFLYQWDGPSNLVATSRDASNATRFEPKEIRFLVADFSKLETLHAAFKEVAKLLIISTMDYDTDRRAQLQNDAIDAAVAAKVGHVYFTSAAWGGSDETSQAHIQQANLKTEAYLKRSNLSYWTNGRSGLKYTIIREGIYADHFGLFLNYNANSAEVVLPGDGQIAWATRRDLAEGTARVIQAPSVDYAGKTVLLTGSRTTSLTEVTKLIAEITSKELPVRFISPDDYIAQAISAGQSEWVARTRLSHYTAVQAGELAIISPTLEQLLGRKPTQVDEAVREAVLHK